MALKKGGREEQQGGNWEKWKLLVLSMGTAESAVGEA